MGISTQIGFGPKAFRKLQSCLVAAEAACSKGDLPVVAVEIALAAVEGLATATETAAVPAELATVVAELPMARSGAAHPVKLQQRAKTLKIGLEYKKKADRPKGRGLPRDILKRSILFTLANNVKDSRCPRFTDNGFEFTLWSFIV